jgi:hypothetical protein
MTDDPEHVAVSPYFKVPGFAVQSYNGLFAQLTAEANQLQPWQPGEFSRRAAAIHEASHCVVAAREGAARSHCSYWS